MKAEDSERWVISVCGLNCAKCDIYQAGRDNEELRNEIIEWFGKERDENVKPEQVTCEGCRGSVERHWSSDCKMMLCARKNGLQHCFECEKSPCTRVNKFSLNGISHHKRTVQNLKRMKEIGIESWIKEQERKGKCVFCP